MASMSVNLMEPVINQQPDSPTSTPGGNVLTSFETSALSMLNNVTQTALAPNGRMPYDPSDPNYQSLIQFRNTSGNAVNVSTSSPGLLIVILLLVVWLVRGRRGSAGSVNP